MRDVSNVCKHVKIHGTEQLESDLCRLKELHANIANSLETFSEVNQNFQWSDELNEPRKNIWLNLYGTLLDLEETIDKYQSMLGIARASLVIRPQTGESAPLTA